MANDFQGQVVEDGSIDAAAALMPDLGPSFEELNGLEPKPRQPRDPQSQQWRSPGEEQPQPQARRRDQVEQEALADQPDAGEPDESEASSPDEEFFEVEVERDGKPVKEKVKALDVWNGYQEAQRIRTEFDDFRKNAIPPEQWDQSILQVHQERQQLMQQLQIQRAMLQPEQPDPNLLNPESPRYNPELYGRQTIAAQQQWQRVQSIEGQMRQIQEANEAQTRALSQAQMQREHAKLVSFWPEIADGKEAAKVRDEAIKHWGKFGVSNELIGSVHNAAFYAILKDAIAYRRGQQAREAAVKVVRAKPKLVRAQARDPQSPVNRRSQAALQRLQQNPNDMDAAVASLDGLFS